MRGRDPRSRGRRLSIAGLIAVTVGTLLMMAWAIFPTAAFADGTITWTGNGSENNEPCAEGETAGFHWIFTTGGGTSSVTQVDLFVNGTGPYAMTPNPPKTQWDADVVSGEVVSAYVNYVGSLGQGNAVLTISHGCFEEQTTTTETTTTETTTTETTTTDTTTTDTTTTDTTTTDTTTTDTTTTDTTTTSSTSSTTTPSGTSTTTASTTTTTTGTPSVGPTTVEPSETETVSPTTVRPGKLAFTGVEDVVPVGALALTLLTAGSGLLWVGSRRRPAEPEDDA